MWENWITTCKRLKLDLYLTPDIKVNSKWSKDVKIRPESIKCIEENVDMSLQDIDLRKLFHNMVPLAKAEDSKQVGLLI